MGVGRRTTPPAGRFARGGPPARTSGLGRLRGGGPSGRGGLAGLRRGRPLHRRGGRGRARDPGRRPRARGYRGVRDRAAAGRILHRLAAHAAALDDGRDHPGRRHQAAGLDDSLRAVPRPRRCGSRPIVADFTPESRHLYLDPAPARRWPTDVSYVATTRDAEFPLDLQRRYAAELGATPTTLPTGHLPMLQDPAALATLIRPRTS